MTFVGANSDLIQGLTDLVQLILWIAAGAVGLISLWHKPSVRRGSPRNVEIQTGIGATSQGDGSPTAGQSGVAIGDFRGNLYMGPPTNAHQVERDLVTGSNIAWAERDKEAVEFFVKNYRDDRDNNELGEHNLIDLFRNWELLDTKNGLYLTHVGCLLFGPADRHPQGTSTDVLVTYADGSIDTFNGFPLVTLFKSLYAVLAKLWQDVHEDPSQRDTLGRPLKASSYPQTAIVEALVNFIVHRDYTNSEVGYINIFQDRIEMRNPGCSPYDENQLLNYVEPLQPKYRRNTKLIWVFSRTRFNQRQGGGLYRIRQSLIENRNIDDEGKPALRITNDKKEDRFTITIYKRRTSLDLGRVTKRYLDYVADRNRYISLRGITRSPSAFDLPLAEIFVPIRVRIELPGGETWARSMEIANARFPSEAERLEQTSEAVDFIFLIQQHAGLVVLGDPGSGKTTLLRYLALQLALGHEQALGLSGRLPFLLPLSAYANALAQQDIPLDRFIVGYYRNLGIDLPIESLVDAALDQGRAVLLLDGLDEIQEPALQHLAVDRVIDFFTFHRKKGNKFVITSRIVGYKAIRPSAADLVECTIVDFDDVDIERFLEHLITMVNRARSGDTPAAIQQAAQEKAALLSSVRSNVGVRQLASNPLLLTIMTIIYLQGGRLPQRRIQLYEISVHTLLEQWNMARSLGRPPGPGIDTTVAEEVLSHLALWMLENRPVGLVAEGDLFQTLRNTFTKLGREDTDRDIREFLSVVREHAGLFVERGPGMFGFIHIVYEEYFASVAMIQQPINKIIDLIVSHVGDPRWNEPILLAISHLGIVQLRVYDVDRILQELIQLSPKKNGLSAILAARAVLDLWPYGASADSCMMVKEAVQELIQDANVDPSSRVEAADVLERLGNL